MYHAGRVDPVPNSACGRLDIPAAAQPCDSFGQGVHAVRGKVPVGNFCPGQVAPDLFVSDNIGKAEYEPGGQRGNPVSLPGHLVRQNLFSDRVREQQGVETPDNPFRPDSFAELGKRVNYF
jgi:hypothetical protein